MCCERPISISLSLARHFQQPPPYHVPHPSPAVFVCVCVCVIVCVSALPAACAPWTVFRHAQVCAYVCAWCFPSDIPSPPSSRSHSLPLAAQDPVGRQPGIRSANAPQHNQEKLPAAQAQNEDLLIDPAQLFGENRSCFMCVCMSFGTCKPSLFT